MRYYDNSATCGNCNGSGLQGYMDYCRECGKRAIPSLAGYGRTRFPLSRMINGCTPPKIGPSTRSQGQGGWTYPYRTTAHKLRSFTN
jgi:hypothetical protein